MNLVRRMTAGRGMVRRSDRTTRSESASTISALPSMTSRNARRMGTMVSGSYDAFSAKHPTITHPPTWEWTVHEPPPLQISGGYEGWWKFVHIASYAGVQKATRELM